MPNSRRDRKEIASSECAPFSDVPRDSSRESRRLDIAFALYHRCASFVELCCGILQNISSVSLVFLCCRSLDCTRRLRWLFQMLHRFDEFRLRPWKISWSYLSSNKFYWKLLTNLCQHGLPKPENQLLQRFPSLQGQNRYDLHYYPETCKIPAAGLLTVT